MHRLFGWDSSYRLSQSKFRSSESDHITPKNQVLLSVQLTSRLRGSDLILICFLKRRIVVRGNPSGKQKGLGLVRFEAAIRRNDVSEAWKFLSFIISRSPGSVNLPLNYAVCFCLAKSTCRLETDYFSVMWVGVPLHALATGKLTELTLSALQTDPRKDFRLVWRQIISNIHLQKLRHPQMTVMKGLKREQMTLHLCYLTIVFL